MIGNIYFDAALQGVKRTYIYQLGDPYNNNTSNTPDDNYGLWNYNETPKTVANSLHYLHDQIPWDVSSSYVPVKAKISGLPAASGKSLALTASDGSIYLFMWNELPVWNNATHKRIDNPYVPVYVTMPAGNWTVDYFNPAYDQTYKSVPQQASQPYSSPSSRH